MIELWAIYKDALRLVPVLGGVEQNYLLQMIQLPAEITAWNFMLVVLSTLYIIWKKIVLRLLFDVEGVTRRFFESNGKLMDATKPSQTKKKKKKIQMKIWPSMRNKKLLDRKKTSSAISLT